MAKAYIYKADEDDVLWMHVYPAYADSTGGKVLAAAATEIWDPATDSNYLYEFYFRIVNQDAANPVVVDIGVDLDGGTTNDVLFYNQQTIAAGATDAEYGPFIINGDAQVNGTADNANDACVFWRALRVRDALI
jgi:hypothetical protein